MAVLSPMTMGIWRSVCVGGGGGGGGRVEGGSGRVSVMQKQWPVTLSLDTGCTAAGQDGFEIVAILSRRHFW